VNNDDDRPYGTELLYLIASSKSLHLSRYRIGTNNSVFNISASLFISINVGST